MRDRHAVQEERAPSAARLVARLVERPDAIAAVRGLSGERFRDLVTRVGLEDAGELLALASQAQLVLAFDDDLFRAKAPSEDESFDVARFLLWLEVLRESGDTFAADRLASLTDDFLALVVERSAVVVDQDAMGGLLAEDRAAGDRLDALVEALPTEEIDRFLLVAKVREGWDGLVAVLVTMDQEHHALVARVLDRVAQTTMATLFDGDEDTADALVDTLVEDVAAEREERRHARGFVSPADARAFLSSAREGKFPATERDPTTRAVLRDLAHARASVAPVVARTSAPPFVIPEAPVGAAIARRRERTSRAELAGLLRESHALYTERVEEIAYVVNALVAGASFEGRAPRPVEAYEIVVATMDLALDLGPAGGLADTAADVLFRRGFHALQTMLVVPAAHAALALLGRPRTGSREARAAVARSLRSSVERGRPWLSREAFLDVVSEAERGEAERLANLFDACPHDGARFFDRVELVRAAFAPPRPVSKALARSTGARRRSVRTGRATTTE